MMGSPVDATASFTGKPETVQFSGILFDMDGTIVDSTGAIEKHWHKYVSIKTALHLFSYNLPHRQRRQNATLGDCS